MAVSAGGSKIVIDFMDALGIDPNAISIHLTMEGEDLISLKVESHPTEEDLEKLIPIVKEYNLVLKEDNEKN
jgi:hypothetical protein